MFKEKILMSLDVRTTMEERNRENERLTNGKSRHT